MASQGPRALGRYVLEEPVATGTTATVWRALDTKHNVPVAIKRFHPHLVEDRDGRRRMEAEAKLARQVKHANIVSAIDVISRGGEFALVFPYVPGETLAARLKTSPPIQPTGAARIAADIAGALSAVHAAGFVHRDVKPGNILLAENGSARLLDFGISRAVTDAAAAERTLTGAGLAIGTLPYMAPEQLSAAPVSPATDVFALGVVLYEMLAGRRPFEAASPVGLAAEQLVPPARIVDAPAPLVDLALRALATDPAARPTAPEFAAALRAWLAVPIAVDASTAITAAVPAAATPRRLGGRRSAALTAVVGVAGLLLVALVALAALPGAAGPSLDASASNPPAVALVSPAPSMSRTPTPSVAATRAPQVETPAPTPNKQPAATPAATPVPSQNPGSSPRPTHHGGGHGHHGHHHRKKHYG
jgi:serine/threonine-protein kinase